MKFNISFVTSQKLVYTVLCYDAIVVIIKFGFMSSINYYPVKKNEFQFSLDKSCCCFNYENIFLSSITFS